MIIKTHIIHPLDPFDEAKVEMEGENKPPSPRETKRLVTSHLKAMRDKKSDSK